MNMNMKDSESKRKTTQGIDSSESLPGCQRVGLSRTALLGGLEAGDETMEELSDVGDSHYLDNNIIHHNTYRCCASSASSITVHSQRRPWKNII